MSSAVKERGLAAEAASRLAATLSLGYHSGAASVESAAHTLGSERILRKSALQAESKSKETVAKMPRFSALPSVITSKPANAGRPRTLASVAAFITWHVLQLRTASAPLCKSNPSTSVAGVNLYRRIGQASCPDFGHREISNGITTFDQPVEQVMTPPPYNTTTLSAPSGSSQRQGG